MGKTGAERLREPLERKNTKEKREMPDSMRKTKIKFLKTGKSSEEDFLQVPSLVVPTNYKGLEDQFHEVMLHGDWTH